MTAPMLSSSRLSARPVIVSPVSEEVNSSISPAIAFCEAVDAGDAVLHLEDRPDLLDVERVKVSGFDLAKEDVLDLAGAERGVGGHTVWVGERSGAGACEKYHKARVSAALVTNLARTAPERRTHCPAPNVRSISILYAIVWSCSDSLTRHILSPWQPHIRDLKVWQEAVALAAEIVRSARQNAAGNQGRHRSAHDHRTLARPAPSPTVTDATPRRSNGNSTEPPSANSCASRPNSRSPGRPT